MKIAKRSQAVICNTRSHWRAVLVTLLLTILHLFFVRVYEQAYTLPTYEQTQEQYSRTLYGFACRQQSRAKTNSSSIVNVNTGIVLHSDCLNYIFAQADRNHNLNHDDDDHHHLSIVCSRSIEKLKHDSAESANLSEYSLISVLLSDPSKGTFSNITKEHISESIRSNVKRLDRMLLRSSDKRIDSVNHIDDLINQKRKAGLRTLKKLSDFLGIDRILFGDQHCSPMLGADLTAIVILISKPDDFEGRRVLRQTWASSFLSRKQDAVRLYFAVGSLPKNASNKDAIERQLSFEHKFHKDLIQFGAPDGYYQLSIKSVALLRWISFHCPLVRAALKTDMDSFMSYNEFLKFASSMLAKKIGSKHFEMHGYLISGSRVFRSPRSKWFTKITDFPAHTYPPYLGSSWLLFGPGLSFVLYWTALVHSLPALLWEDVWITGVVTQKLSERGIDVKLVDCAGCLNYFEGNIKPLKSLWLITQIPHTDHNQTYYLEELFKG